MALLFIEPLSHFFIILYAVCGLSDICDGYIARKMKATSSFGAAFDSVADALFIGVCLLCFVPLLQHSQWIWIWIGVITAIRLASLVIGYWRHRALSFLHTYANKATGFVLFGFPFLYQVWGLTPTAVVTCSLATLSAIEELVMNSTFAELALDRKSLFLQ